MNIIEETEKKVGKGNVELKIRRGSEKLIEKKLMERIKKRRRGKEKKGIKEG